MDLIAEGDRACIARIVPILTERLREATPPAAKRSCHWRRVECVRTVDVRGKPVIELAQPLAAWLASLGEQA